MKIKVVFTNGKQKTFTGITDDTFREYQKKMQFLNGSYTNLYFREAIVPYAQVLYLEEVLELNP